MFFIKNPLLLDHRIKSVCSYMFSKSCQYGIRAILHLAVYSSEKNRLGVTGIADKLEVPKHFLAKILQQLTKANLISSTKGPSGGYFLNKKNQNSNLKDVIEALDGTTILDGCILGLKECSSEKPCPLHFHAFGIRESLNYQLEYQTIEEIAEKIKRTNISI